MARSSTRKAMHGGNFMGMMNVLMQLRKVCNHPDLFEPRSVVTPFAMEPISMSTAACVINVIEPKSGLERLSSFLLFPLWSIGQGLPTSEASSHDELVAGQLTGIVTPATAFTQRALGVRLSEPEPRDRMDDGLKSLLTKIRTAERKEHMDRAAFVSDVNSKRCNTSAFMYSDRLQQAITMEPRPLDLPLKNELTASQIAMTPTDLLAMRKSLRERAADANDIIDKFVFCVPKAGTRKPILFSGKADTSASFAERNLLSKTAPAFEECFSPFQTAESRLSMYFPEKKLIQFDAGKLQTLATLLRDLKQGGHRVLIFTQMSKMVSEDCRCVLVGPLVITHSLFTLHLLVLSTA